VIVLLLSGLLLVGVCAALVGRALALPRLQAMERIEQIGAYGFSSAAAAASPPALTGVLERIARLVGGFFAGRLRGLSEAEMRRELMAAGAYRLAPVTLVGYRVMCTVAVPTGFMWAAGARLSGALVLLGLPAAAALGWAAPLAVVRRRARRRLERIDHELPELVDLLVVTVESGMGFAGSMQVAAERFGGPLGEELRLALQEQAMGLPSDQALANMLARTESDGMRSFVRSVRQGEALGVSIGQIMRNLSREVRERRRANAEERAQKAPIKILFPLVGLIFPAIFVVLLAPALLSFMAAFGGGS
jgi:tight adherence protein C